MKYRCLVFDHDDTVVNSTATIHHPCFEAYLREFFPGRSCSLEEYFLKNFHPGFIPMCKEEYGLSDADLEIEYRYWQDYVRSRIPQAYPGLRELMERHRAQGSEVLMIDDLKPGYDMARAVGVDFAAVGWANDIPQIESFMRQNCRLYFKTVAELAAFLEGDRP